MRRACAKVQGNKRNRGWIDPTVLSGIRWIDPNASSMARCLSFASVGSQRSLGTSLFDLVLSVGFGDATADAEFNTSTRRAFARDASFPSAMRRGRTMLRTT